RSASPFRIAAFFSASLMNIPGSLFGVGKARLLVVVAVAVAERHVLALPNDRSLSRGSVAVLAHEDLGIERSAERRGRPLPPREQHNVGVLLDLAGVAEI